MAFFEMHYHSDALGMGVTVNVILPEKAKTLIGMAANSEGEYKTLYLFHGLSDDHSIWMRRTSIERYAAEYGIAVVMPSVARSWYTDMAYGSAYFTFVTKELPTVCRSYFSGMSQKKEDTLVAGLSMGGYGAIKAALSCPDTFGGCASLSGALDLCRLPRLQDEKELRGIFGDEFHAPSDLEGTKHDLFALASSFKESGKPLPKMYLWCGDNDFLLEHNKRFVAHLKSLEIEHLYEQSAGDHSWGWWDMHIQDALKYLLK